MDTIQASVCGRIHIMIKSTPLNSLSLRKMEHMNTFIVPQKHQRMGSGLWIILQLHFFKKNEKGFITSQETAHIYKGVISISYGDNYVREYQKY